MKMFFVIILSLLNTAAADQTTNFLDPKFDPCLRIQGLALLNKDNSPYWVVEPSDRQDVLACYSVLKLYAQDASESALQELQSALGGRIRIFNDNEGLPEYLREKNFQPHITLPEDTTVTPEIPTTNPYVESVLRNGLWEK